MSALRSFRRGIVRARGDKPMGRRKLRAWREWLARKLAEKKRVGK